MNPHRLISNRFELQDLLGRGGMGEVYRATDTQTGETVAVKALNTEVVEHDPSLLERFVREGGALRQLNHPNIVHMIAAVEEQGQHYLVMEFVEGGSLRELLNVRGSLPANEVVKIALEVADALARAHHLKIIHRDLKPGNILLAKDGDGWRIVPADYPGGIGKDAVDPVLISEPGHALVLEMFGAHVIVPVDGHTSRLLVRGPTGADNLVIKMVWEPMVFTLERRMLLGLKARAERTARLHLQHLQSSPISVG